MLDAFRQATTLATRLATPFVVFALLWSSAAMAASPTKEIVRNPLILAVSEGTSGGIDAATAEQKYAGLMAMMAKALAQPIRFEFVRDFKALEQGMKERRFDLVMARPSDYPARGLRDHGYHFVATAAPAGHCQLIVAKDSPLTSIKDLKGQYIILPEKVSYMTSFCLATLRDEGLQFDDKHVFHVYDQDAIPFGLEHGMAAAGGVASYSRVYKRWLKAGHRVLHSSPAQPYMPVIAGPRLDAAATERLKQVLTGLASSPEGQAELDRLGITGFVTTEEVRLRQLLGWLFAGSAPAP
jgi:ABC-type phosphate/phosphonate transport system substrate-binding protein